MALKINTIKLGKKYFWFHALKKITKVKKMFFRGNKLSRMAAFGIFRENKLSRMDPLGFFAGINFRDFAKNSRNRESFFL